MRTPLNGVLSPLIINVFAQDMDTSTIPTCPWCRCEIKGTESVVIEPYKVEEAVEETEASLENLKVK